MKNILPAVGLSLFTAFSPAAAQSHDKNNIAEISQTLAQEVRTTVRDALKLTQQHDGRGTASERASPITEFMALTGDRTVLSGNFTGLVAAAVKGTPSVRDSRFPELFDPCEQALNSTGVPDQLRKLGTCTSIAQRFTQSGMLHGISAEQLNAFDQRATAIRAQWHSSPFQPVAYKNE